jgi:hypothetical protein
VVQSKAAIMDKAQIQKERDRLQAVLDRYDALEPTVGRHVGIIERIANLDRRIAIARDI